MLNLLFEIQRNREIIKRTREALKGESNNNFIRRVKKEFEEKKSKYKLVDSKLNEVEKNIEQLEKKLEDMKREVMQEESKLYGNLKYDLKFISTLEKSIELKKGEIRTLEEDSLNRLYDEENLLKERDMLRKELVDIKNEFYKNKKVSSDKIIKSKMEIKKAEDNILNCEKKVPKKLLDKFNELCELKGTGAAKLSNGVCSGCKMKVSAITIDDIKNNKDIVYCDNCGRIIYYSGHDE